MKLFHKGRILKIKMAALKFLTPPGMTLIPSVYAKYLDRSYFLMFHSYGIFIDDTGR